MNRTDELTDKLIDGTLTDAGVVELHALLEADPNAQVRHRALVRLELVLRGLRTEFGFAEVTVAKIEAERVERTTHAVLAGLAEQPPPAWDRRPGHGRFRLMALAALTAALLVGIWFASRPLNAPVVPPDVIPAAPDFARVTSVSGAVEVAGPDGPVTVQPDLLLRPDQTLRTIGDESGAVLEFADRTRVEVHPDSSVRFGAIDDTGASARTVFLVQGRVTATATGRRMVVGTGSTEVEATRGSFSLWSSGLGSARVETRDGDVRVVRTAQTEPVALRPGRAAFVRDEETPVRIESAGRVDAIPRDRLNFPALDVGFAPDGEVWAVSAKQWARWRPGAPDQGRTMFLPRVQNDGLASWLTPDRTAIAVCRTDDREERIVIRAL
ncbi:MAG: FecR family protein, partial [Gemmataceae bacterium]|nr:FecR family protein [Gemmataceae bacterium]